MGRTERNYEGENNHKLNTQKRGFVFLTNNTYLHMYINMYVCLYTYLSKNKYVLK